MGYEKMKPLCKHYKQCGGCQLQHLTNESQNRYKEDKVGGLLSKYGQINPILSMEDPYYYRNKIHRNYGYRKNDIVSGMYRVGTHRLIEIEKCIIEDPIAERINTTIKQIMKKYKMTAYDEDEKTGFLRHVLIRTGLKTGEVMVVLVTGTNVFPGKKNFIKLLVKKHPEIKSVVMNINNKNTSMILGDREEVMYGPGFIVDVLCGVKFRISSKSFYQINPKQTEVLYSKALDMAGLKGHERMIDAYCGIGTIGLIASSRVQELIGVELNKDATYDAIKNTKLNDIKNAYFHNDDAGDFMVDLADKGESIDIVVMDPPRAGSDEKFLSSMVTLGPEKIVYISCNPETQARDLEYLVENGYGVREIQPVDMFPQTEHIEVIALLERG